MARTDFFGRCTRFKHVAVLTSLLIIATLCIAQDANQSSTTMSASTGDANGGVAAVQPSGDSNRPAVAQETNAVVVQHVEAPNTVTAVVVPGKAEPNQGAPQADVLTPLELRMRKTVSVEFKETPIDDVIRQMAAQADVDIIKSPKVVGNVTATLKDVPLDEALSNILAVHGAAYVAGKNMIRVVPVGELPMEQAKTVTIVKRIMYADVKDVAAALDKYVSKSGQISYSVGTSNIIVTDTEDKIKAIDAFIKEIDRVTPQVLVESKIYEVTTDDALDLGIEWSAGTATKYGIDGTGAPLGSLDKFGQKSPFDTGTVTSTAQDFSQGKNSFRFGWLNNNINIDALIRANQKDVSAKLLANPRVLVLDNEKAEIKIITEVPYQELSQTAGGGNIGTTQFKDVGVELYVTPHITGEGLIRLKLKPVFSTEGRTVPVPIPGTIGQVSQVPAIDKRQEDTIALVKDGDTVVLGGLRRKEIRQEISKVPLLGDIPIVGLLFRFQGEHKVNTELVVFVRPWIKTQQNLTVMSDRECKMLEGTETTMPRTQQDMLIDKLKKN